MAGHNSPLKPGSGVNAKQVQEAIEQGIAYLRREQKPRGNWNELTTYPGPAPFKRVHVHVGPFMRLRRLGPDVRIIDLETAVTNILIVQTGCGRQVRIGALEAVS